ncbi:MAG: WYL domain-containing protein, partial [Acidimicrobiia bacterium]|nr:WYL domain-containing protein [Acidimicrobiia bacterium]
MSEARRSSAPVRMRRVLSMIPWLAANDGPTVDAVCARFRISEAELRSDLALLSTYVGVPPYTPDQLFHITVERGRVFARLTPTFDRPLRLTPEEGIALVVAGRALGEVEGADPDGPLARALVKVAAVLGIDPDEATGEAGGSVIDVDLGTAAAPTLALLRTAQERGRQVEIDHYSHGRDERQRRVVDPWAVANEGGAWYLVGWDHLRAAERSFRIDRVLSARILEVDASPAPAGLRPTFAAADADPRVTLRLSPEAQWVVESYPVEGTRDAGDGRIDVTMAVSGRAFLERLLLRLG